MIKAAKFYAAQGYSVIATGDTKRAILPWKQYQTSIITDAEIKVQFNHPKCSGLAVICGAVSGNLEVIDVDLKYDRTGTLWQRFTESIATILPRLYVVRTKSGGYHLYYKCEVIEGNQKLANRPATTEELKDNPNVKQIVLIETRGEAGYVIAPPTPGYEKQGEFIVPVLSIDDREAILSAARSFNEVIEEVRPDPAATKSASSYQKTPWDDYNDRSNPIDLLQRHGWTFIERKGPRSLLRRPGHTDQHSSGDYHHELGLFKVFSTSTQFEIGKGYKPFAIYTVLEHAGDFSRAAKQLIADGYGEIGVISKYGGKVMRSLGMGVPRSAISKTLIDEEGLSKKDADRIINEVEDINGPEVLTFWEVSLKGSRRIVNILRAKLVSFLFDNGFHLFFYDKHAQSYRIVQQKDGFVQDASFETIKKFVKEYIESLPEKFDGITPSDLLEVVMKGADTYFGKGLIEFLSVRPVNVLRDTATVAYFPFANGIVKVDADGPTLLSYGSVNMPIWRSQVIDFNIDIEPDNDVHLCEFYDLIHKMANGEDAQSENDMYLCSLIGYLLHRYKDPAISHAVILAEETEDEKKGGGTGKGLLVTALSYMANLVRVDGKNFKVDKNFAFQRVKLDTKILAIEDVRKNVDFEGFYSMITEGFTVEKKNKDEFFIPYRDSPKIVFTTNYTVGGVGGHGKRRQKIFEFSNYFSVNRTPLQVYKHRIFDDWDSDEWNRFYNLMFFCVSEYLARGIRQVENSEKIQRKHMRLNFTPEFMEWWDAYLQNGAAKFEPFKNLYTNFCVENDFDKKDFSQKRFRAAIQEAAERFGLQFYQRRNGPGRQLEYSVKSN